MTLADIARVRDDFAAAARRARDAGFEWLELHFAHGYLAQSFFSPSANQRTDAYGGSFDNRARFLRETLAAVRAVWPERLPLTLRFGVVEFDGREEETLAESIELVRHFKADGTDLVSVSAAFTTPTAKIPWGQPGFMVPFAERVRREVDIPVATAWGLGDPLLAERVVAEQRIDLALIGKPHLANPHWPYAAALALNIDKPAWVLPAPYAHWLS
jgi:2,4-dienoyl-CoA reductase-like NADH-dependent reductase (Old Yellow Enzyme family)